MVASAQKLYKSGMYFNGQATPYYGGSKNNEGYYVIKLNGKCCSTHRLIAWIWPKDGLVPVMPWMLDVDHIHGVLSKDSLAFEGLQWLTRTQHAQKTRGAQRNDEKGKLFWAIAINREDPEWQSFDSMSEASRQLGIDIATLSEKANGNDETLSYIKDGDVWMFEFQQYVDQPGEEWKPCRLPTGTFAENVFISNLGMIKKLTWSKTHKKYLEHVYQGSHHGEYFRVEIQAKKYMAHDVVLSTWGSLPPFEGAVGHHKNEKKGDNRIANLEWLSQGDNLKMSQRNRVSQAQKQGQRVQPFFDAAFTQPAREPFHTFKLAAADVGVSDTLVKQGVKEGEQGRPAGPKCRIDGRAVYWKRVESDIDASEPHVVLTEEMLLHVRHLSNDPSERDRRTHSEDAEIASGSGRLLVEAPAPSADCVPFFERGDEGMRHFVFKSADGSTYPLGSARCDDELRLTARCVDGVWRVYQLAKQHTASPSAARKRKAGE